MSVNKYLEGLAKPFDAECVKWRIQVTNNEKTSGLAVAYLDSRTIAKRLDEVVGQMRWKDEYKPWITAKITHLKFVLYQFMMIVLKSG